MDFPVSAPDERGDLGNGIAVGISENWLGRNSVWGLYLLRHRDRPQRRRVRRDPGLELAAAQRAGGAREMSLLSRVFPYLLIAALAVAFVCGFTAWYIAFRLPYWPLHPDAAHMVPFNNHGAIHYM